MSNTTRRPLAVTNVALRTSVLGITVAVIVGAASATTSAAQEATVRRSETSVAPQRSCHATVRTIEHRDVPAFADLRESAVPSLLGDVVQCTPGAPSRAFSIAPVYPRLRVSAVARLPLPQDDGELWAGRGTSGALRAGFLMNLRMLHVVVAPELVTASNNSFDHEPARDSTRSSFASPFYSPPNPSIDYPTQFGADAFTRMTPGASAAWISAFGVSAGWSASPQRWGPGQHGSLLLGTASAGIPRAFVRTTSPLSTRLGVFDAVVFLGTVTESPYFDRDDSNNFRSLSAAGLTWSPSLRSVFTVGAARGVMRASESARPKVAHFADALSAAGNGADQLISMFARIGRLDDPLSAWVEVGRNRAGFGLRSFLTLPYDATSYIIGARGLTPLRHGQLSTMVEFANLEQGEDVIGRAPQDFYTGAAVPQGWTQRGRPLGHWVGPGGQTQFVAVDWLRERGRAGVFFERVRRNEDALFREFLVYPNRHDVSFEYGLRAAFNWAGQEFSLDVSSAKRLNFEFQNATYLPEIRTVDVRTPRIRFSVTPLSQR